MTTLTTARDRYNTSNSLLCLVQALEGRITVVELQNEMAVEGCISQVDGFMNVSMCNALVSGSDGQHRQFDEFFIRARNIRYVRIPDDIDIGGAIKNEIEGKQSKKRNDAMGLTTKAKLARKRQKEMLISINREEQEAV